MSVDVGSVLTSFSSAKDNLFSSLESRHCAVWELADFETVKGASLAPTKQRGKDSEAAAQISVGGRILQLGRQFCWAGRGCFTGEVFANIGGGSVV